MVIEANFRLALRTQHLEPAAGPDVAKAQVAAFRE
jgi:hypothetical protein